MKNKINKDTIYARNVSSGVEVDISKLDRKSKELILGSVLAAMMDDPNYGYPGKENKLLKVTKIDLKKKTITIG